MELRAGVSIQNNAMGSLPGTLTCFGVLRSNPSVRVLLSCEHVLFHQSGPPRTLGSPHPGSCPSCCLKNVVAHATLAGIRAVVGGVYCDCAIAHLTSGVTGLNQISGLARADPEHPRPNDFLAGSAAAVEGSRVVVASFQRILRGTIEQLNATVPVNGVQQPGQITIRAHPDDRVDTTEGTGDSGAAVIDEQNRVVGLMHSRGFVLPPGSPPPGDFAPATHMFACPIGPVLDVLGIDIPAFTPATLQAGATLLGVPEIRSVGPHPLDRARLDAWERRLRATALGRALADAGRRHGPEIRELVHHCRPVLVAWHRSRGPAWAAHLLNAGRDEAYVLPDEVDGITRRALLERMRDALAAHGSEALRGDLMAHGPTILECALSGQVEEIASSFEATARGSRAG